MRFSSFQHQFVLRAAALVLLCMLPGGALRAQNSQPSATDILRAMMRAERTASLTATETVTQRGAPVARMRIWRAGFKRRVEFLEPPVRASDLLVDDGANVWLFHNSDDAAVQTKSTARALAAAGAEKMPSAAAARVVGTATVGGRRAWIVEMRGRGGQRVLRRLWIDQVTGVRLRAERFGPEGRRIESAALSNVRFGPVPASRFHWTPPAGAKVTRTTGTLFMRLAPARTATSWLQYPRVTPPGYVFESAVVDDRKGEAWLRYTNGRQRFSIFQQRAAGRKTAAPRSVEGGWYWQNGGSRLLGVGLPSALAEQVAKSVR